jgi:hypothetical protein
MKNASPVLFKFKALKILFSITYYCPREKNTNILGK